MAEVNKFTCLDNVPNSRKLGLNRKKDSESHVTVEGDLLDGLTLFVKPRAKSTPTWEGALSRVAAGIWNATLKCTAESTSPEDLGGQVGDGDGEPDDVPVTVTAGTNLGNPQVTNNTITVPVG